MNRWQGWARRLRARHGRSAVWRPSDTMELLRAAHGVRAVTIHTHGRPAVSVHTHVCFAPLLTLTGPVAPGTQALARPTGLAPSAARAVQPATGAAAPAVVRIGPQRAFAAPLAAPALVAALRGKSAPRQLASLPEPRHLAAQRLANLSIIVAHAAATALRVRRNAVREETRPAAPAAILGNQSARKAAVHDDAAAPMRARPNEMMAAQGGPAINIEALAGQVIQQIDRRMIAYRERMGRG